MAKGSLKLNGVLIPRDLSNLSYEQIMALLNSVNLPPEKGGNAGGKSGSAPKDKKENKSRT